MTGAGFFSAIAMVGRFAWHCRTHGWGGLLHWERPEYLAGIHSACRGAGMTYEQAHAFGNKWAIDAGGTGPL